LRSGASSPEHEPQERTRKRKKKKKRGGKGKRRAPRTDGGSFVGLYSRSDPVLAAEGLGIEGKKKNRRKLDIERETSAPSPYCSPTVVEIGDGEKRKRGRKRSKHVPVCASLLALLTRTLVSTLVGPDTRYRGKKKRRKGKLGQQSAFRYEVQTIFSYVVNFVCGCGKEKENEKGKKKRKGSTQSCGGPVICRILSDP